MLLQTTVIKPSSLGQLLSRRGGAWCRRFNDGSTAIVWCIADSFTIFSLRRLRMKFSMLESFQTYTESSLGGFEVFCRHPRVGDYLSLSLRSTPFDGEQLFPSTKHRERKDDSALATFEKRGHKCQVSLSRRFPGCSMDPLELPFSACVFALLSKE